MPARVQVLCLSLDVGTPTRLRRGPPCLFWGSSLFFRGLIQPSDRWTNSIIALAGQDFNTAISPR